MGDSFLVRSNQTMLQLPLIPSKSSRVKRVGDMQESVHKLPAELQDVCLDYLHPDRSGLANCSLVCRAWARTCRYHLFKVIIIKPHINVQGLLSIMKNPKNTIAGALCQLHWLEPPLLPDDTVGPIIAELSAFDDFISSLPTLSGVQTVSISGLSGPWPTEQTSLQSLARVFPNTRSVNIMFGDLQNPSKMLKIMCNFPHLQQFSISAGPAMNNWRFDALEHEHSVPNLHTLSWSINPFRTRDNSAFYEWLASHTPVPPIENLSVPTVTKREILSVAKLIKTLARSLQTLAIGLFLKHESRGMALYLIYRKPQLIDSLPNSLDSRLPRFFA